MATLDIPTRVRALQEVIGHVTDPFDSDWIHVGAGPIAADEADVFDPYRPQVHFTAPSNWTNDPNGVIYWRGRYHLFYQYNPHRPLPDDIHWGHAVSDDLVRWRHLPIALAPSPGGPDQDGCWSGCAVVKDGVPYLLYTGVRGAAQLPCLARADDVELLTSWRKYRGNPVISSPPRGLKTTGFRDHTVWVEDGHFHQLIGTGIAGQGGAVLHYRSADLLNWDYLGPFLTAFDSGLEHAGTMWECPDFFRLGDRHVLMLSIIDDGRRGAEYIVGSYENGRFRAEGRGTVDAGDHFYASQSMIDPHGRRLGWGWLREHPEEVAPHHPKRVGLMSVPRVLSLSDDRQLQSEPAPELEKLRGVHWIHDPMVLDDGLVVAMPGVVGQAIEVKATIRFGDASEIALVLRFLSEVGDAVLLRIDRRGGYLALDQLAGNQVQPGSRASFRSSAKSVQLHILVDHSVVEVFSDLTAPIADMVYPMQPQVAGIEVTSKGGRARLEKLDAWRLGSIWTPVDESPGVAAR